MSKKYVITTNAGGIEETKEYLSSDAVKYFDSIADVLISLVDEGKIKHGRKPFLLNDFGIRYSGFDTRINCHRFMILIPRYLDDIYAHHQFYRWLLEVDVP